MVKNIMILIFSIFPSRDVPYHIVHDNTNIICKMIKTFGIVMVHDIILLSAATTSMAESEFAPGSMLAQ